LEDKTIVVFTSDNGGFSTTKGGNTQMPTCNLPLRFGKGWMYEGGIRVPAIVKYPGIVEAGIESDLVICGYDLYPTVLSLAGLPLLPEQHVDGLAVFDPTGRLLFDDRIMIWYYPQKHVSGHRPSGAIRRGAYKLILNLDTEADQHDRKMRLFNIERDISETTDLSAVRSDLAISLGQELEAMIGAYE
jgi:arylsulfatase A-like enzyme